jgi:hypothetical protein
MRKHELLTEHERRQLLSIPENRDDLARLYTLSFRLLEKNAHKRVQGSP